MILMRIFYREKYGGPRLSTLPRQLLPIFSASYYLLLLSFFLDELLSALLHVLLNQSGAPSKAQYYRPAPILGTLFPLLISTCLPACNHHGRLTVLLVHTFPHLVCLLLGRGEAHLICLFTFQSQISGHLLHSILGSGSLPFSFLMHPSRCLGRLSGLHGQVPGRCFWLRRPMRNADGTSEEEGGGRSQGILFWALLSGHFWLVVSFG